MADSARDGSSPFYASLILVLLTILGSVALRSPPLEPLQPASGKQSGAGCERLQNVDARMWEDPLACTDKGSVGEEGSHQERGRDLNEVFHAIARKRQIKQLDVVAVLVSGAPYMGSAETRRRTRYAVLSALHDSGYTPHDPLHLGLAKVSLAADADAINHSNGKPPTVLTANKQPSAGTGSPPLSVPYEIYWGTNDRAVWLLWIDEEQLRERPLAILDTVFRDIESPGSPAPHAPSSNFPANHCCEVNIKIIGPQTSSTLQYMLQEIQSAAAAPSPSMPGPIRVQGVPSYIVRRILPAGANGPESFASAPGMPSLYRSLLEKVEFYSPSATTDDAFLLRDIDAYGDSITAFLRDRLNLGSKPRFFRTIPTDQVLAKELLEELKRRGLDWPTALSESHMVLISEWDTVYGRGLLQSIEGVISNSRSDLAATGIKTFSYMRGLDGLTPEQAASAKSRESGSAQSQGAATQQGSSQNAGKPFELAQGNEQFDYLRRLADNIRSLHNTARAKGGEMLAIGVIGSEVCDKLLILRALRPLFPGAIFFTTDLDARFLDPKELEWTRNLVVASAFGLELEEELQSATMPFRSSYQTAQYLAVRGALAGPDSELHRRITQMATAGRAKIFEIGTNRAIELPTPSTPVKAVANPHGLRKYLWLTVSFIALLCFGLSDVPRWFRDLWKIKESAAEPASNAANSAQKSAAGSDQYDPARLKTLNTLRLVMSVLIAAGLLFLVIVIWYAFHDPYEPLFWAEGVSVWPTEIIRVFALVLALCFIWRGLKSLVEIEADLNQRFFKDSSFTFESHDFKHELGTHCRYRQVMRMVFFFRFDQQRKVDREHPEEAERLWWHFRCRSRIRYRMARVALVGVVFMLAALSLMNFFGPPHSHARGGIALMVDRAALFTLIPAFVFLLFLVVDATRLCKVLAQHLIEPTAWPDNVRKYLQSLWAMPSTNEKNHRPLDDIDSWLDISFFTRLSKPVTELIYYPFLIFALMIVARSNTFDRWETPPGLAVTLLLSLAFACYSAFTLRSTAEKIREANLKELNNSLIRTSGDGKLRPLIDRIELQDDGAFAPFYRQPVLKAILLPTSAYGLWIFERLPSFF